MLTLIERPPTSALSLLNLAGDYNLISRLGDGDRFSKHKESCKESLNPDLLAGDGGLKRSALKFCLLFIVGENTPLSSLKELWASELRFSI